MQEQWLLSLQPSPHKGPHNLVFPCMSLVPLKLLPLYQSECLQAGESVCGLFKGMSGFPITAFAHTGMNRQSPCDFHSQILWGLLFPAQDPWVGEPSVELRFLSLQVGTLTSRCPSCCSNTTYRFGVSPYCFSTPPSSLNVISSLYPQRQRFCSSSLQMILEIDCSIILL